MTTTIYRELTTPATATVSISMSILPQLIAVAGSKAARAGKDAYDLLAAIRNNDAATIDVALRTLAPPSIKTHRLDQAVGRCSAFAAGALADANRHARRTGSERISAAMQLLDDTLCAGW